MDDRSAVLTHKGVPVYTGNHQYVMSLQMHEHHYQGRWGSLTNKAAS